MGRKLNFELVPDGCWYVNLRSHYKKSEWDVIRNDAKKRAGGKCMICGAKTDRLEAHERWSYDDKTHVQKLEDVIAVCKDCHSVIHIGRTQLLGNIVKAEDHYMKVNGVSYAEYRKDLGEANELHKKRNLIPEWITDITWAENLLNSKK